VCRRNVLVVRYRWLWVNPMPHWWRSVEEAPPSRAGEREKMASMGGQCLVQHPSFNEVVLDSEVMNEMLQSE
ncbi:hypothetical protein GCK32_021198, partial [Trichostrongylus colubriformis]